MHRSDPQTCFTSRNSSRMTTTSRKRSRRCRRSGHHNRSTVAVAAAVATATQLLLLLQQPRDVQAWVALVVSPRTSNIRAASPSSSLSSSSSPYPSSSRLLASSLSTTTDHETTAAATTNTAQSYYDYDLAYSRAYYDDDDDEFENEEFEEDIAGFLELQSSTGSEILPTALQELVNQGPSTFLQDADMVSGRDVSDLELVAMRSITEQLPQAAVRQAAVQQQQQQQQQQKKKTTRKSSTGKVMAKKKKKTKNSQEENKVTKKTKAKKKSTASTTTTGSSSASSSASASGVSNKKKKKHKNNLHHADSPRVTPEQEMELARTIQQGAALHKLWTDHVMSLQESDNDTSTNSNSHGQHHGRRPLLKKWAQLAGLTPKELRRQVADYRQAKHVLVTANMGLVHAVVNQVWSSGPKYRQAGISKDELVQEGSLGLLRAAELFDPAKGLRFSTYAVVWIKGTLSNTHVPELVRLPAREKTKWNKIQQAQRDILLLQQQGQNGNSSSGGDGGNDDVAAVAQQQPHSPLQLRVPVEEIAAYTGLSVAEILATQRHMSRTKHVLSLDYEYQTQSRSGDAAVADTCSMLSRITDESTANLASQTQLQADVLAAMAHNLDAREGRLMRLRYGLSEDGQTRTLQECADAMGLSYTRVHQLAARCLKKLRQAAEAESLQEYLLTIA